MTYSSIETQHKYAIINYNNFTTINKKHTPPQKQVKFDTERYKMTPFRQLRNRTSFYNNI